jgi:hypothetical protein
MSPSHEGVVIQAIGILPLALLSFLLSRSIGREHLRYWWRAWACLAVALFALYATLRSPWTRAALEPVCFFGELLFAGLIVAGCRNLSTGARLTRSEGWLLAPAALLALALTYAPAEFTVRFIPQAALLSVAIPGSAKPLPVTASAGVAAFDTLTDLERAIEVADDRMYQYKQRRRATGKARRGG